MATRKTSTQAKTKTTKRTAAARTTRTTKSAKATRATKATKPAKAAKAAAPAKAAKVPKAKVVVRDKFASLRQLNVIAALVLIALAVTAGVLMSDTSFTVGTSYVGKDELASQSSTVFANGFQGLFDVPLKWAVVVITGLSALLPLLYASRIRERYQAYLGVRYVPFRWWELGITTGLMMEVVALLSGVQDIATLKLVGGLMITTCLLGLLAERENMNAKKPVRGAFMLSLFTGFLPWVLIAFYAVSTYVYGLVRYPWHVYALYGALFVGFSLLCLNQWRSHKRQGASVDYLRVERNYLVFNLLTKAAFAGILIAAFQK